MKKLSWLLVAAIAFALTPCFGAITTTPIDGGEIDFSEVNVGSYSDPQYITIINNGPGTITVTDVSIDHNQFNAFYQQNPIPINAYNPDSCTNIQESVIYRSLIEFSDNPSTPVLQWYSFEAVKNQLITINLKIGNPGKLIFHFYDTLGLEAFTRELSHDEDDTVDVSAPLIITAGYTGTIYFAVELTENNKIGIVTSPLAYEFSVTTEDEVNTIIEPKLYEKQIFTSVLANNITQVLTFDATFGDTIELTGTFATPIPTDDDGNILVKNTVVILGPEGQLIKEKLIIRDDAQDPQLYSAIVEIAQTGNYTIMLIPEFEAGTLSHPYNLTYEKIKPFLELLPVLTGNPDEIDTKKLAIPVWYTPIDIYNNSAIATVSYLENGQPKSFDINLKGYGWAGNLSIGQVDFPGQLVPGMAQSGKPLDIIVDITNTDLGAGGFVDNSKVRFYLSTDNLLDLNEDTLLLGENAEEYFLAPPVQSGKIVTCSATVMIPLETGQFYLITTVNYGPERDVIEGDDTDPTLYDETSNILVSDPIFFDPYSTSVSDSKNYLLDMLIDFGKYAIGRIFPVEHFTVYNRTKDPITITSWVLEGDPDFELASFNEPENIDDDIILQPGKNRKIWIRFVPKSSATGVNEVSAKLTVSVKEDESPRIMDITGIVTGAHLAITENSDIPDDGILEFGPVMPGFTSQPQIITLSNAGNDVLYINDITFQNDKQYTPRFDLTDASKALFNGPGNTIKLVSDPNSLDNSVDLEVVFSPELLGQHNESLTIHSSDPDDDYTFTVKLNGFGAEPILLLKETSGTPDDGIVSFGRRPIHHSNKITIPVGLYNNGSGPMTVYSIALEKNTTDQFAIIGNPFDAPDLANDPNAVVIIEPKQAKIFEIEFFANELGFHSCILKVEANTSDATHVFNVTGKADDITANIVFPDGRNSLAFEPVILEYDNDKTTSIDWFYIRNTGNADLYLDSICVDSEYFKIAVPDMNTGYANNHDIDWTILPGQMKRVDVLFDAENLSIGTYPAIVTVKTPAANGSTNDQTISAAVDVLSPEVELEATKITFANTPVGGEPQKAPLVIKNEGTAPLKINNFVCPDEQFIIQYDGNRVIDPNQTATLYLVFTPTKGQTAKPDPTKTYLLTNDVDEHHIFLELIGNTEGLPNIIEPKSSHSFHNANGEVMRIAVTNGYAIAYLEDGQADNADISRIELYDTTEKSQLKITGRGTVNVGEIVSDSSLSAIKAPGVNITEQLVINGSLSTLTIGNVTDDAFIDVASGSKKELSIKANEIGKNVTFDLNCQVNKFQARNFQSGNFNASAVKSVKITDGDLGANFMVGGTIPAGDIGSVYASGDITGDIISQNNIKSITSKNGKIADNVIIAGQAQLNSIAADCSSEENYTTRSIATVEGNIGKITAKGLISATILANDSIRSIATKDAAITGVIRAKSINTISANSLDNAVISAADSIATVKVKLDVINSLVLAGYDIGMSQDLNNSADDILKVGSIKRFQFGGEYRNSYVAAGSMTDNIYSTLYSSLPSGAKYSEGTANIGSIKGKLINANNNATEFGFYSSGEIKTKLQADADFVIKTNYKKD
ncbi:MAG: hypothetical protein JEZ07_00405 [Phycisphaerae bacterium]|nr:hypothetical protein [Phycisphaerae bacterium]